MNEEVSLAFVDKYLENTLEDLRESGGVIIEKGDESYIEAILQAIKCYKFLLETRL